MARNLVCNECGETMQVGYIPDPNYIPRVLRIFWISGYPKRTRGALEKLLSIQRETKYLITAYRCEKCGYVKMYAEQDRSKEEMS